MSLLDRGPRSATVVAESDMRLLVLEPREFDHLIQASPKIAKKLLVEMAHRVRALDQRVTD
jgi:CRP-like cAMP-binding protein